MSSESQSSAPASEAAATVKTGAQIVVDTLVDLGVETMFGYTGGVVLPLFVPGDDEPDRGVVEPVEQRQHNTSGISEHRIDAEVEERIDDDLGARFDGGSLGGGGRRLRIRWHYCSFPEQHMGPDGRNPTVIPADCSVMGHFGLPTGSVHQNRPRTPEGYCPATMP
jgi:hypothetical protein